MATVYITEYAAQAADAGANPVPAGQEPAIAHQTVAITVGSVQSAVLNARTRFVRVHTDAICSIKFGTNPTAVVTEERLAANATEFFGIAPDQLGALKIAVISNT